MNWNFFESIDVAAERSMAASRNLLVHPGDHRSSASIFEDAELELGSYTT